MREIRDIDLDKSLRDLLREEGTEELSDKPEEVIRQIQKALEKPAVKAVVVFPLPHRRRFPIPPRKLR